VNLEQASRIHAGGVERFTEEYRLTEFFPLLFLARRPDPTWPRQERNHEKLDMLVTKILTPGYGVERSVFGEPCNSK
jgi:hypothetical protein